MTADDLIRDFLNQCRALNLCAAAVVMEDLDKGVCKCGTNMDERDAAKLLSAGARGMDCEADTALESN